MYFLKSLVPALISNEILKILPKIGILLAFLLTACSPAMPAATAVATEETAIEIQNTPTEVVVSPPLEPSPTPAATAESDPIYPYFRPQATELDIPPQTIDGVTTKLDWVYVDEGRVAIHYTVSGLDWPDGSYLDGTQQVHMSSPILADARFGGFSGQSGGSGSMADRGVIIGYSDQLLVPDALDAEKNPTIDLNVDIPVEGPTKVGTFHFNVRAPVANGIKIENIDQTVTANNVAMTLKSLILNPSYAQALICFQMPSQSDWGLMASKLSLGDNEYPVTGAGISTGKSDPASASTSPERCNDVGFDIAYQSSATSLTLTVPRLQASINEVVTKDVVAMANQRLAEKGIEFDYANVDHGGNIEILKRPDGIQDPELYQLIWDAMAEQYEGPWVFTVDIPR